MKKYIWNKFLTILNSVSPEIRKQLISFSYLAKYYGQYNSIKKNESVDANNNPLPWITYPAIEYLGNLDFSKEKIFEVGSGNSTIWFSKRANKIISLEEDEAWFKKMQEKTKNVINVDLLFIEDRDIEDIYFRANECSVIFIDGLNREKALDYITKNIEALDIKCIVVDNSELVSIYEKIQKFVLKTGWVDTEFVGFGPQNRYVWSTTVLTNPKNRVVRKSNRILPIENLFS